MAFPWSSLPHPPSHRRVETAAAGAALPRSGGGGTTGAMNGQTKARQSAETRARLVAVATRLFAEYGYAATSTEMVVREAGTTGARSITSFATSEHCSLPCSKRLSAS